MDLRQAIATVPAMMGLRAEHRWRWLVVSFLVGGGVGAAAAQWPAGPVALVIERFERKSPSWVSEQEGEGALFSVEVPRVTGGCGEEAKAALNGALLRLVEMPHKDSGAPSLEVQASSWLESWRGCRVEYPTSACVAQWWTRRKAKVLHNRGGLLSVQIAENWYSGGNHSNYRTRIATFDVSTGRRIDARDLLGAADRERLAEKVVQSVLESGAPCIHQSLVQRTPVTDNVAVVEGGLLYSFDPYEISGFVQGVIQHVVPWSVLDELRP